LGTAASQPLMQGGMNSPAVCCAMLPVKIQEMQNTKPILT